LYVPLRTHRSAGSLAQDIENLAAKIVAGLSEAAARLRHGARPELGEVSSANVFMSAPWGRPNLRAGRPDFVPHMQHSIIKTLAPHFDLPEPAFMTAAGASTMGMRAALPYERSHLLAIVTHEVTE